MTDKLGKNLTEGSILKHMISFSIPVLIGYFLYTGYGIINTIWVGNLLGEYAVAASAISFVVVYILIALATGVTLATTILISQYYGANDQLMVRKVVNNSYLIALILSLLVTVVMLASSGLILKLMQTPPEIFGMALSYLKISLYSFGFLYTFFLVMAILRGIGDTLTPMVFLIISTSFNAILDPILISGWGPFPRLELDGAAYASLVAQGMAVILGLLYTKFKCPQILPDLKAFSIDRKLVLLLLKIGIPSMLQQTLMALSILIVTSFVNTFGTFATAAYGAATKVDSLISMVGMSLAAAAATVTGQNLGAGKPERIKEVFKWGVILACLASLAILLPAWLIPKTVLSVFVHESKTLEIGSSYLRIVGVGYVAFTIMYFLQGIFNGAGNTFITMVFTLVSLWVVRVPLTALLSATQLGYRGIWIAIFLSNCIGMGINLIYYLTGKWSKSPKNEKAWTQNEVEP